MFFTRTTSTAGIARPWGSYDIRPTPHGIEFIVTVRDPRNNVLLLVLLALTLVLTYIACTGFFNFLYLFLQLLGLGALLYVCLAGTKLIAIEVRPDGMVITPSIDDPASAQFFHRDIITRQHLDYDGGLTFRYGIHDIRATPPFANRREFECFEQHFEVAIARLWHQSNLQ
jgi:hypothetical protein